MGEPIRVGYIGGDWASPSVDEGLQRLDTRCSLVMLGSSDGGLEGSSLAGIDCLVVDQSTMQSSEAIESMEEARSLAESLPIVLVAPDPSCELAAAAVDLDVSALLPRAIDEASIETLSTRIETATNRQTTDAALSASRGQLETVIDNLPGIAYQSGTNHPWPMTSILGDCDALLGYDPSALLEGDISYGRDIIHSDDQNEVMTTIDEAITDGEPFELRYRIVTADGDTKWVYESGQVIEDPVQGTSTLVGVITDITGWYHHRERQRVLFEDAADAIVEVTFDGDTAIIDRVNPAFEDIFGISGFEVVDRPINETIVPPADRSRAAAIDERVRNGEIVEEELQRKTADGLRWFLLRTVPFSLGDEQRGYATYIDITDQKEREHAIESLHTASRSMLTHTSIADIHQAAVDTAASVLGLDLAVSFEADNAHDRLHPRATAAPMDSRIDALSTVDDDSAPLWDAIGAESAAIVAIDETLASVLGAGTIDAESALLIPLGESGVIVATAEPDGVDEADRRLAGLLGSATGSALDAARREAQLTELHRAATAIGSTESVIAVYEQLIAAAEDILEFDFAVADAREGEYLVTMATSSAIEDDSFFERTPIDATDNIAAQAYRSGTPDLTEDLATLDVVPADPTFRSALTVPVGEYGVIQAAAKRVGAFDETDLEFAELLVTHARQALTRLERTRELEDRSRELNRQNERLEQFAELVSHDLRNPLSVIGGRLALARESDDEEHLDAIEDAVTRMEAIIDDTLMLAREGRAVGETEPVELATLANRCWSRVATADATLQVRGDLTFEGDPERVKHILENLFRNAIEHGDGSVTVTVGPTDNRDGFFVADDGPGIPADKRSDIFDAGYSTGDDGVGIGLSIVTEIVEAHGWTIEVADSDAGGARFVVTGVEVLE